MIASDTRNSIKKSIGEKYLPALKAVSPSLAKLVFSPLRRPSVLEDEPPTQELLQWAVQLYCFSLLSHYREMLRTFLSLSETGAIPAAFVISRCLFEIGAHTYYVHKHVTQYLKSGDLKSAWEFLKEINMGNRYMTEKNGGENKNNKTPDFPLPREVAKVVRCFNEVATNSAVETYSYLSEFAHPNMAAFNHYYRMEPQEGEVAQVEFIEPSRDSFDTPLAEVAISVTATLNFTSELLVTAREGNVSAQLTHILNSFIDSTKKV